MKAHENVAIFSKRIHFGLTALLVCIPFGIFARPAKAALVPYTDRASWTSSVGPLSGTENFNSFAIDASFKTSPVAANNMSISGTTGLNGAITQLIDVPPIGVNANYSWDGSPLLVADIDGLSQFVRINFLSPVVAWGGDTVGLSDFPKTTQIHVFNASNVLLGVIAPSATNSFYRSFYGFRLSSDAASYIRFVNSDGANDVFTIDNIGFVNVPEPVGLLSLAFSVFGFGWLTWPRR